MLEILLTVLYMLLYSLMFAALLASWKLLIGQYKPAAFIMNIFAERRKTAEATLEAAKVEHQTEQLRLERSRLDKTD